MTPFPASYSTLCPVALASLITARYCLQDVQCTLLVRGVGDTYLVETNNTRYIFRVYRSSHRTLEQVEEEVALLLRLKQAGVKVSYPIPDVDGKTIQQIDAVEGKRNAVLFSYAKGASRKVMNEAQLRALGTEMARFHNVSAGLGSNTHRWHFDVQTTLYTPISRIQNGFKEDPETLKKIENAVIIAANKIEQAHNPASGYCHFDFLPKNFHFDGSEITIFDFDFMGHGLLVNDVMTFWQHLELEVYAGRMKAEDAAHAYSVFLEAYKNTRAISTDELALIPYLSLGFWLFYMGFHTTHDQFLMFTTPAYVGVYASFLQHIIDKYWN